MRSRLRNLTVGCAVLAMSCCAQAATSIDDHRPQTWFHLIGGNVSKEGLTADLEAIKSAELGGIQFFHGQMGSAYPWPRTHGQIPCLSAKWDDMVRFTADECARLGLKFEMQNCPGWSMSGGPWITLDKAMRKLVCFRPEARPAFDKDDDFHEICRVKFPMPIGWDESDPVPIATETNGNVRVYRFAKPVSIRTLELPPPNGLNYNYCYEKGHHLVFEAKTANGWRRVVDTDYPRGCWQDGVSVSFACGDASASEWRLMVATTLPAVKLDYVRFHAVAKLDQWEALGGWAFRDLPRQVVLPAHDEGMAELVFGHVNMKVKNGPAPEEARGWECDKLDPEGFRANFDGYLGRLVKGQLAGGKLKGMVVDSWECGCQSWTAKMEEYFEKLNGYALRPNLPTLFGYPVGDVSSTEKFLRDWRRTVSRLVEEHYYRVFAELGRANGLTVQFETAFQDVIPGDPLRYWKYADIPMCEFWQPFDNAQGFVGSDNFKPVRPCVSAAHIYGKRRVQAEALTSFNLTFDEDFNLFKPILDRHFARGVTHIVFHSYTHNPQVGADFLPPGTSFAWGIGSPFLRGQTWWKFMPQLSDYVARCGRELERGLPVVDVLWYLGDDNPYRPDENADFPKGYKYDYITQDALLERVAAKDGRLVLPDGMSYRMLWIPEGTFLLPESEAKVAELERAGAKICRGRLRIDWPSPLKALLGRDPDGGVQWYQRRDGDEDIFFILEKDGTSAFVYLNRKADGVRIFNPITGEEKPLEISKRGESAVKTLAFKPCAEYPAWATEREYVATYDAGAAVPEWAMLDLGEVKSWAEVFVNGRAACSLWVKPYACDIGNFLKPGKNEIRVKVTSTWYNRLVHDAGLPESERTTWVVSGPAANVPLKPTGLLNHATRLVVADPGTTK